MASTRQMAMSATDIALWTELRREHAATSASSCRLCPIPPPVPDASSEHTCGKYTKGEELSGLAPGGGE